MNITKEHKLLFLIACIGIITVIIDIQLEKHFEIDITYVIMGGLFYVAYKYLCVVFK